MIKIMIERHAKPDAELSPLLQELRAALVWHYQGYVTGETLVNAEDRSIILTIGTWRNIEDWKRWEKSETRARITKQIEPLLQEKPKIKIFELMASEPTQDY